MQTVLVTLITLVAFAANSVLCRWTLMDQTIDPLSFSVIRILSGAFTLLILLGIASQNSNNITEPTPTALFSKLKSRFRLSRHSAAYCCSRSLSQ